jgi:hypothetical protein
MDELVWLRLMVALLICGMCIAAWKWTLLGVMSPDEVSAWQHPIVMPGTRCRW